MNFKNLLNRNNLKKYLSLTKEINNLYESLLLKNNIDYAKELEDLKNNQLLSQKKKTISAMAFAKKAASEVLGMPYYDVQLIGALALVDGCIAEMKTGEGKTLTCSAAVAANYVLGYSTHVATANEYLAQRDLETLKPLYEKLGLSNAYNISTMPREEKRQAYKSAVIYSTAQELGFDFLRDNLIYDINEKLQNPNFSKVKAIIDEADFILIDEARTPLIISGESPMKNDNIYQLLHEVALKLQKMEKAPSYTKFDVEEHIPGDFWLDEKYKNAHLSESGYDSLEKLALEHGLLTSNGSKSPSLYNAENSWLIHELLNALKAEYLYIQDKDYIVQKGEIVIIDQNTGRLSHGRTWSYGLHQALEAKEKVKINPETMTLGSISIQNYFRNYSQISGMSGTIMESSHEFEDIYQCKTIQIPTNRVMIRRDHQDKIYLNINAKYDSIITDVVSRHNKGQPILIGTTSVAESEIISNLLEKNKIAHHVLNAKNNALEAQIIAQAGQPYSVTVATSMAGRGTDIILGGNKEILHATLDEQLTQINARIEQTVMLMEVIHDLTDFSIPVEPLTELESTKPDLFQTAKNQEMLNQLSNEEYLIDQVKNNYPALWNTLFHLQQVILKQKEVLTTLWTQWKEQVLQAGGLCVIGSSRNESRRIDDQLRGRAGRQGDVGESVFYLSTEDSWVSMFGKNPIFTHLAKTLPADQLISSNPITNAFAKIQRKIEGMHSESRKNTYQYDSVADEGRKQFLKLRNSLLEDSTNIKEILHDQLVNSLLPSISEDFLEYLEDKQNLNTTGLETVNYYFNLSIEEMYRHITVFNNENPYADIRNTSASYEEKLHQFVDTLISKENSEFWTTLNSTTLVYLDKLWTEHLVFIDEAQQNVGFRAIAQKNPLYEYKKICFDSFASMLDSFRVKVQEDYIQLVKNNEEKEVTPLNYGYDNYRTDNYSFAAITKLVSNEPTTPPLISALNL